MFFLMLCLIANLSICRGVVQNKNTNTPNKKSDTENIVVEKQYYDTPTGIVSDERQSAKYNCEKSKNESCDTPLSISIAIMSFILAILLTLVTIFGIWKYKEVKHILDDINRISKEIIIIEKKVTRNQTYIQKGLENVFDYQFMYANLKKDRNALKLVYSKRAVCNLYSLDEDIRFAGITALKETGTISDLHHLENIINDPDEIKRNKILASDAREAIKSRSK